MDLFLQFLSCLKQSLNDLTALRCIGYFKKRTVIHLLCSGSSGTRSTSWSFHGHFGFGGTTLPFTGSSRSAFSQRGP